jgi:hypothetical protein
MKSIPGIPHYYATRNGEFYSDIPCRPHGKEIRRLKPNKNKRGYLQVMTSIDGKRKLMSAHRLVALTYIPNPENKPEVNHKDGCKANNNVENLEWATRLENQRHAFRSGLCKPLPCHLAGAAKLTMTDVEEIRLLRFYGAKLIDIAPVYGVGITSISRACRNKTWKRTDLCAA